MEHSKHLFRVGLLLVIAVLAFTFGREAFVPESYGVHGPYRFDNVAEQRQREPVHGARDSCKECHDAAWERLAAGAHASIPCESCHAALSTHVRGGRRFAAMLVDRSFNQCSRCHRKMLSRPTFVAQIVPDEHVARLGATLSGQVCIGCHPAHSPRLALAADGGKP